MTVRRALGRNTLDDGRIFEVEDAGVRRASHGDATDETREQLVALGYFWDPPSALLTPRVLRGYTLGIYP